MIPDVEIRDIERPPVTHPDPLYLPEMLPDWHLDAACRGMDPAIFFPERGKSSRKARATCAQCPVQAECLEAAVETNQADDFGIWGGTSERQRRPMRRAA